MDPNGNGKRGVPKLREIIRRQRQDSDSEEEDSSPTRGAKPLSLEEVRVRKSISNALRTEARKEGLVEVSYAKKHFVLSPDNAVKLSMLISTNKEPYTNVGPAIMKMLPSRKLFRKNNLITYSDNSGKSLQSNDDADFLFFRKLCSMKLPL